MTKMLALIDASGNVDDFCLMSGQAGDLSAGHLLAARGFNARGLRNDLKVRSITAVLPPKLERKILVELAQETTSDGI